MVECKKILKKQRIMGTFTHKTKDQVTQTPLKTGVEHLPAALVAPLDNEYRLHSIFTNFYSLVIELSDLRFMDSDYPFGIFKLF
jgi:hypothetical protein